MRIKGMALCVVGGVMMLGSFVFGLISALAMNSQVVQTFPFALSQTPVTSSTSGFSAPGAGDLSLWLRVPGRGIENKGIILTAEFIDTNGSLVAVLSKEFGFWHTRSGSPQGQLYEIGSHHFADGFKGTLELASEGSWRPSYDASFVLRKSIGGPDHEPALFFGVFTLGVVILTLGVSILRRNQ